MLVMFDIDGTLANAEHRLHHVRSTPKNWPAFFAGLSNDTVIEPVAEIFHSLRRTGNTLIFGSGRGEEHREQTMEWLGKHHLWDYRSKLYLRPLGDRRHDDIVKFEFLEKIKVDFGQFPDMIFEDRPRVIKMWRANGLFAIDVYQGEEDF